MNPIEIALKKKPGEKYTILESIIMAWNVKHPADAELAADELAALTAELETVKRAANNLIVNLPESEIDLAREVWSNTNANIVLNYRNELAAALKVGKA